MRATRSSLIARTAGAALLALVAATAVPGPAEAGPVARGAAWGAVGGAVVGGIVSGKPLAGAAVGAATGALIGAISK